MAEILAALKALPQILSMLMALGKYLKETFGDNPEKFIADAHQAFVELRNAKTSEDKRNAARAIAQLISRL